MSISLKYFKNIVSEHPSLPNTVLATVLLLTWVLPSTFFWQICVKYNVILPNIPYFVWFLPGELWRMAPGIHIVSITAFTVLYGVFWGKKKKPNVVSKNILITVMVLIILVHIIWGFLLFNCMNI